MGVFRNLTVCGKKLVCSLVVRQRILLYLLADSSISPLIYIYYRIMVVLLCVHNQLFKIKVHMCIY